MGPILLGYIHPILTAIAYWIIISLVVPALVPFTKEQYIKRALITAVVSPLILLLYILLIKISIVYPQTSLYTIMVLSGFLLFGSLSMLVRLMYKDMKDKNESKK